MFDLIHDVGFWQFISCIFFAIILLGLIQK